MSYINTNIDHYTKFMESNLGINDMDVKKATSPNTILEHIIDFITFGGVKKELTKQYSEFCSKIVDTLEQSNGLDRYEIPKILNLISQVKTLFFQRKMVSLLSTLKVKSLKKELMKNALIIFVRFSY